MLEIWEFIKKHRGKIITGAVIAGGAYALQQTLAHRPHLERAFSVQSTADDIQIQARKQYIYDSNQRTCDTLILELLPTIADQIFSSFNVEMITEELKTNKKLTNEERLQCWQSIKEKTFGRIIALAYAYTLTVVTLKCQMSTLAAQYSSSYAKNSEGFWWNQYIPKKFKFDSFWPVSNSDCCKFDPMTQQIYLKCSQFFATEGIKSLVRRVQMVCKSELESTDLKKMMDVEGVKRIFKSLKRKMEIHDRRHFSDLIVPNYAAHANFSLMEITNLDLLLVRLVEVLESSVCRDVTSSMVEFFIDAVCECVGRHNQGEALPLARVLPLLADNYNRLSSTGFNSPIQNIFCSTELHSFATHVFSLPPLCSGNS